MSIISVKTVHTIATFVKNVLLIRRENFDQNSHEKSQGEKSDEKREVKPRERERSQVSQKV